MMAVGGVLQARNWRPVGNFIGDGLKLGDTATEVRSLAAVHGAIFFGMEYL